MVLEECWIQGEFFPLTLTARSSSGSILYSSWKLVALATSLYDPSLSVSEDGSSGWYTCARETSIDKYYAAFQDLFEAGIVLLLRLIIN